MEVAAVRGVELADEGGKVDVAVVVVATDLDGVVVERPSVAGGSVAWLVGGAEVEVVAVGTVLAVPGVVTERLGEVPVVTERLGEVPVVTVVVGLSVVVAVVDVGVVTVDSAGTVVVVLVVVAAGDVDVDVDVDVEDVEDVEDEEDEGKDEEEVGSDVVDDGSGAGNVVVVAAAPDGSARARRGLAPAAAANVTGASVTGARATRLNAALRRVSLRSHLCEKKAIRGTHVP
ncbi:MAG TPA: hypothetical protein VME46_24960 [Acidimicrobiales bacterium]|nr:hypothetical protein [Acidimicrobiales bacterium]